MTAAVTEPGTARTAQPFTITDEQLRALTADERRSLAGRLAQLAGEAAQGAAHAAQDVAQGAAHVAQDAAQGAAHVAQGAVHAAQEAAPVIFPRRRWFVAGAAVACASMIAWIVLLSQTLPARYVVGHWDAAWVGFDVILLLSMAAVGFCAWRLPAAVPIAALVTTVLLVCDAWFDVSTSAGTGDLTSSVVLALALELPLAAGMAYLAYRRYRRRRG